MQKRMKYLDFIKVIVYISSAIFMKQNLKTWARFGPSGQFKVHEFLVLDYFFEITLCAGPKVNTLGGVKSLVSKYIEGYSVLGI